ncbi:MAG: FGGY family carbohydrate kinase, partial [Planctomycetota bacterium]
MAEQFVLALDQGTTSSRAVLYDRSARARFMAQQEFEQIYPQPSFVEHDAMAIRRTQLAVTREVLAQANVGSDRIAAVGIANQRETVVVWDRKTGVPIHNAIVWQDRRTASMCAQLKKDGHEPRIAARTGLLLDPYFSATKIRWLLDHVAGARTA